LDIRYSAKLYYSRCYTYDDLEQERYTY
jgi:hypothetical protein